MISVVIPVKDGGEPMRRCLAAISAQRTSDEVEIVVVDSGSTDGTQECARALGARVHEIPAGDFNHGGTRNLGARIARGEIVVFTVDDALPLGEHWLEALTAPLRASNRLAGTYARQVAYDHAPPHQRYFIEYRYGRAPRIQRATAPGELSPGNTLFSNVASAIPRRILERFPFADDIVIAEDLEWCARVLLAGYEIAYVPEAVVRHSHRYTLAGAFKRYFDQGAAAKRTFMATDRASGRSVRRAGIDFARQELVWLWRSGRRAQIPYTLAHEAVRYAAFKLGAQHRRLPAAINRRLSRTPSYWSAGSDAAD